MSDLGGRRSKPPRTEDGFQIDNDLFENSIIHKNISQEVIITTVDKIRLCLHDYKDTLKAQTDWVAPAGILITLVATLSAADFKLFLGLNSDVWKALFIFGSIMSAISLIRALNNVRKIRGKNDVESIIQNLKQGP